MTLHIRVQTYFSSSVISQIFESFYTLHIALNRSAILFKNRYASNDVHSLSASGVCMIKIKSIILSLHAIIEKRSMNISNK